MDPATLVAALTATISIDAHARNAAEAVLNENKLARGQMVSLFRVAMEGSVDAAVRQVAAISFKNVVKFFWESSQDGNQPSPLAEEDKATIRENLLEAIARAPHNVRLQLEESMRLIVHCDWPNQWPSLLGQIQQYLQSQDQAQAMSALRVLRVLARNYEFKDEAERTVLFALTENIFPVLITLLESLIQNPSPAIELAEMMKLCLKTFWSSIYMDVPPVINQEDQFRRWMAALHALMLRQVPLEHMPQDEDSRNSWQWWKLKKWVMHIAYRLFNRYGDPNLLTNLQDQQFAARFKEECSLHFLSGVLQSLASMSQGAYVSPRVANLMLQFVTEAIAHKQTWAALKPHVEQIIVSVVFPLLCFDDDDQELWENDPQDYVRKGYDIIEDMYSTRTAAMGFLHQLCQSRPKQNLDMIMAHILTILNEYKSNPQPDAALSRKLDGALLAIGTLNDVLQDKQRYKGQLEPMLQAHIAPLFTSPYGHLRAKACWMSGIYADIDFLGGKGKGPTFVALLQQVIQALNDPDLPVRVDAAISIRSFLEAVKDEDLGQLKALIPSLLERFLTLSQETESEDLTFSLEAVIERFGDDIAPYAVNVCQALSQQFWRIVSAAEEDDEEGEDAGPLGAYSVLEAMYTVLDTVSSMAPLFPQMEEFIFPILDRYTSSEGADIFEEITQLITCMTYYGGPEISPRMWSLYPKLLDCLGDWAIDYFDCILMPLDNYISKGTEVFLQSQEPNFLAMTNTTLEKVLVQDVDTQELACAPKLMGVIMQHCRGRVDHCIGPYLKLALDRFKRSIDAKAEDEDELRDNLLLVIADALYYNPVLSLSELNNLGLLTQAMEILLMAIFEAKKNGKMSHFTTRRGKKLLVLGLTSLLTVTPHAAMPDNVNIQALSRALMANVRVLVALKKQEEVMAAAPSFSDDEDEDESGAGGDSGNESDDEGNSDEEDDVIDEAAVARWRRKSAAAAAYDDDDDDWDDFDDDDDVSSPIDQISPYIFFAEGLQNLQAVNPQRFAGLTSVMDAGVQQAIQGMMGYAMEMRAAEAAAQQQGK